MKTVFQNNDLETLFYTVSRTSQVVSRFPGTALRNYTINSVEVYQSSLVNRVEPLSWIPQNTPFVQSCYEVPPQAAFRDRRVKSDSATSRSSTIVEPMSVLEPPNSGACFVWTNEPLL